MRRYAYIRCRLVGGVSSVAAVGPILGGFLITYFNWRYGFGMEVLVVMAMIRAAPKILEFPGTISWRDLDIWGTVLSAAGLFLAVLGILQLNNVYNQYLVPYLIITGLIAFYLWQERIIKQNKSPLLDINLLKIRIFFSGGLVRFVDSIGLAGIIFIIPVFMGTVVDSDAFTIGLSLLPLQ